jgi:signal-transduction protein with cAMP-binding, CBS, and nucleotidyltransferase domain
MSDFYDAYLILQEKYDELKDAFDAVCAVVISQQINKGDAESAYDEITAIVVENLRIHRGSERCG